MTSTSTKVATYHNLKKGRKEKRGRKKETKIKKKRRSKEKKRRSKEKRERGATERSNFKNEEKLFLGSYKESCKRRMNGKANGTANNVLILILLKNNNRLPVKHLFVVLEKGALVRSFHIA